MTLEDLMARIEALEARLKLFEAAATIPYEVDQAFRARLKSDSDLAASSKGATSESQTVQESGSSSYGVLKNPDAYLEVTVGTTLYYIPVFT